MSELLVVIAMIALLAGLLIPVLSKASGQGRRTVWMANIRPFIEIEVRMGLTDQQRRLEQADFRIRQP